VSEAKVNTCLIVIILVLTGVIAFFCHKSDTDKEKPGQPLGIGALIDSVKKDLVKSQQGQAREGLAAMFVVDSFDLEVKFTINKTTSKDGRLQLNFGSVGSGESSSNELVQTIKLHMSALPSVESSSSPASSEVDTTKMHIVHLHTPVN
jgi:hypothetical protein